MSNGKARILVVDDEPFYTEVLQNLLWDDYHVTVAKNGEDALRLAREEPLPDLIMLDILLPGIDGYEVCRQLKQDPVTSTVPVIFLTVKSDVDDEVRGFQLGAVDYITKPMSPPIVKARTATHIKISRMIRQLDSMLKELRS
ncbi:MAG: response regulator [Candidatus Thiodiazotropha sp.]|jgi:putative two-component system response regulator